MSRFAISDIHGCANTFKALLRKIKFSKEDTLYLLGDYIDRGPDSRGVIDHIWELQEDGYAVHCLRGNHEQMLLDELAEKEVWYNGEPETLKSFHAKSYQYIPIPYIEWMEQLPYFFDMKDYILVHAGLNFKTKFPLDDTNEMIWIRHFYDDIDKDWLGNRIIVHGHTPTRQLTIKTSMKELSETPAINIDGGCVYESFGLGHLCAINLDTKQLIFHANIDKVNR